jgi:hypothetical protein
LSPAVVGTTHTVTLNSNSISESGSVRGDSHSTTAEIDAGDSGSGGAPGTANLGIQAFVSWDITGIPNNATITDVKFDLSANTIAGNPFSLGCLKAFPDDYGAVDGSDFKAYPPPAEDHEWCAGSLGTAVSDTDFKIALQSKVGSGRLRYRFQFNIPTNSDNNADIVQFSNIKVTVTYVTP